MSRNIPVLAETPPPRYPNDCMTRRFFWLGVLALGLCACGDPVPRLPGKTPQEQVLWAAKYGDASALRTVLIAGADTETRDPGNGWTPLIWASVRGFEDCVVILVDRGADLEARGRRGQTALILATRWGQTDAAHSLLANGANASGKDNDGWSALLWASFLGREQIARALLDRGTPPDLAAQDGFTPLMAAARRGRDGIAELLLERGADPLRRGPRGRTAADMAGEAGHDELARRLRASRRR